ncbi:MAG: U32 family peptidase [Methanobrevibacter sp.]|jgi:putative protease|nr:U32 family peptidase [Methanobrevibacter sp.]
MVELLTPAGNLSSFNSVLKNGADSIYVGLDGLNMRNNANNFNLKEIKNLASIVHQEDKKLYLCTNIVMKDKEIEELKTILPEIYSYEVDALIVSDLGMVDIAISNNLSVHLSVQNNTTNLATLKTLKKIGVTRAILSRELSLNEIEKIAKNSPIETEIFIHGAMCMGISGRCFLSYSLYGENANCGKCLQPCRKEWTLIGSGDEKIILEKSNDSSYKTNFLSAKDLTMIEYVPELIKSGVDGFKIEGRGRSSDYVSTATRVFREAIDLYNNQNIDYKFNPAWLNNLKKVFNRGFDTGFYFNQPYMISKENEATYKKKDIGKVVNYYRKINVAELKLWDELSINDEIIIQGETTGSINQTVKSIEINGIPLEKGVKGENIAVTIKEKVRKNDHVYKLLKS